MYNTEQKTKYYIYDLFNNAYVNQFESEEELVKFLVKKTYKSPWCKVHENQYLDNIAMNGNDVVYSFDNKTLTGKEINRRYFFIDSYNRIFDARKYWPIIKERYVESSYYRDSRVDEYAQRGDKYYFGWSRESLYHFRSGPVPYIHNPRGYCYIRLPHTTRELKDNCNDMYKDYVRGRRKFLPTAYDDIVRNRSRSWKDCTKKRKQWM